MTYSLGIDVGTTFCKAAIAVNGQVELINLGGRAPAIPSVVLPRHGEDPLVGVNAEARAVVEPERVACDFKRRLGNPTPMVLGGTPYSAHALTTLLIRHVHAFVVERMGGVAPTGVVITHPASFGEYRQEVLRSAAVEAGVHDPLLVTEPVAVAAQYQSRATLSEGEVIAVYDFGGGTFDLALLRFTDGACRLLGEAVGVADLGGSDFDSAVLGRVNDLTSGLLDGMCGSDHEGMLVQARLRRDCRDAKESLSADTEAIVPVLLPGSSRAVEITRADFETMIAPRITETFVALQRACDLAGIRVDQISRIVLAGGSSLIPSVRERVASETGRPVAGDVDPVYAVALGAARVAAEPRPVMCPRRRVDDVVASTVGASSAFAPPSMRAPSATSAVPEPAVAFAPPTQVVADQHEADQVAGSTADPAIDSDFDSDRDDGFDDGDFDDE